MHVSKGLERINSGTSDCENPLPSSKRDFSIILVFSRLIPAGRPRRE